jgi:ABC-type glycerol-3-phosphate transport system substrate-binding protein
MLNTSVTRRQLLKAGAAAVPAAWVLSACGTSSGGKQGSTKTLSLSDWWGTQVPHYLPIMQRKTGIKIDHQVYSYNPAKIFTELASGTAPDLFFVGNDWSGELFPYKNYYVPFDDELKARGMDLAKFSANPLVENGYDGKIAVLSIDTSQDLIVYINRDMAEQSGLLKDAPLWGTSTFDTWKWDTYIEWLKAGTKRMHNGKVIQYGLASLPVYPPIFSAWLHDMGGTLFDDDWHLNETVSRLDSEQSIAAAQQFADLVFKYKVAVPPSVDSAVQGQGGSYLAKLGMSTINLSTGSIFPEAGHFPMTYMHLPPTVNKIHALGSDRICVNPKGKDPKAALDWAITFVSDPDVQKPFLVYSSVPSYNPLPIVNGAPAGNPKVIAEINLSRIKGMSAVPNDTENVVTYMRGFGRFASAQAQNIIQAALDEIVEGKTTAKAAMTEAKKLIDVQIANGRRAAGLTA